MDSSVAPDGAYVPESAFGDWFLGTETWKVHVLQRALADLERLIPQRSPSYPVVLDVGCGWGRAFRMLKREFKPERIVGVDISAGMVAAAGAETAHLDFPVELHRADCSHLPLENGSVDLVFCHQSFHHLVAQPEALGEFHRVLRRGGLLLFAESTRAYIHSWGIRLLFRHPMDVQRTAAEYIAMIRLAGFQLDEGAVSYPYLWWSRPDLGLAERVLGIQPKTGHEETLINLVAVRP
ncbi:MAG TPA: class I SAM-dependent methyltransferase [Rhizomicrobium sp.]|nr:class I SAM-dependent methyltransferase [Rhizomicrobium sp.]